MSSLGSLIPHSIAGEDTQLVAGAVGVAAILATTAVYYAYGSKDNGREFPKLRGIQLYHAWNFFQRRYDFLRSNVRRNAGRSFSFNILQHDVVVLAGEDARQAFFSHPRLSLTEGHRMLMGGGPKVRYVDPETGKIEAANTTLFNKNVNKLFNKARIQTVLPTLLEDIIVKADRWGDDGKSGRIDPFNDIYYLVVAMTTCLTVCHDLTKNDADLEKVKDLYQAYQTGTTPITLLLPWLPTQSRGVREEASRGLFTLLFTYVEAKRHAEPSNDAIDVLIAGGETTHGIVGFIMIALFAGTSSTGLVSCWMLIDLGIHSEWREKCKKEIQGLLSSYLDDSLSSATIGKKLAAIPVSAWEDELPVLDACIRETHRMVLPVVASRRNLYEDIEIGGRVVKHGDYIMYSSDDIHMNPEYYPEPYKYDPGRWLRPDPVPNTTYPFIGWGAGRHPCPGMKAAKFEMKLILAMFLTRYDYELVDKDGRFPNPLPVPNRNDIHLARPIGAPCYFDFKRVVE